MSLLQFFQWCYATQIGETIRDSTWLFPAIEAFHLLGLGLTVGAVLIVDLRLLGLGLSRQPAAQLVAGTEPWLIGSLTMSLASGIPLFLSEAEKCYFSFPFWVKMVALLTVLIFTFTFRRRVALTGLAAARPAVGRYTALVSLCLWFAVGWGGRWIGFS
jgi:hypothetical protein